MFTRSSEYYDAIYASFGKDYAAECAQLRAIVEQHIRSTGRSLLDVACGTGAHLAHLREHYDVEGIDLDPRMLSIAARRVPGVPLHVADMRDFDLGRRFDVVTCLFSSIGYVRTPEGLARAVHSLARHLESGGVLVVEPWLTPESWQEGRVHALYVDEPELKVVRMCDSRREGTLSTLEFHYLVGKPSGVEHFTERHEMGLFTREEYVLALESVGLEVSHDPEGFMGRGRFVGVRPPGR
jgi:SAM-dependent methyltransferase